ncbi:MAG TPA: hypothetical protein VNE39_03800 [Planctomycetota bacterium]|nr:hypothetical protein [Planctomycetota bacterium]
MRRVCAPAMAALLACSALSADGAAPENLAGKAAIASNSEYSAEFLAKFVADGKIPEGGCQEDRSQVWACQGSKHSRGGATITFTWPEPVAVAEIVYYGRTGMVWNENWKDWQLFLDGAAKPVQAGQFKSGHGPQRIQLKAPATIRSFTLKFPTSYGGPNPGAAEIQVYASAPPPAALGKFFPPPGELAESEDLAARLREGRLGFDKLLVIHRHEMNPSHVYTYHCEAYRPGGALYVMDVKTGELAKIVDSPNGQILDCELSYDATEVLFSWKQGGRAYGAQFDRCLPPDREPGHQYRIWRCKIDGSDLTPLTDTESNNFNACWLPDGGVAFLSDRKPAFAYCWVTTSPVLYRMDRDGGNVVRLSANYLNDFTPGVMHDGRIIYSRWEYVDRPACPIQSLWTINPDGTGLSSFYGNRVLSPGTFMEARSLPGSDKIICTMVAHNGACRGAIGIIDRSRGVNAQEAIRNLTPEVPIGRVDQGSGNTSPVPSGGPYESPCPIDHEYYLVSKRGTILVRDYAGREQATVLAPRDGMGWYCARPVRATLKPLVRNSSLPPAGEAEPLATLFLQDVYKGLEPFVKRGEIKQLAVVQELEKSTFSPQASRSNSCIAAFGFQFPLVSCGATYAPKKLWGYAKVEPDGSACFKVPTGIPIYFLALDAEGRAVQRMRSFTHLMPGEKQGCVGCHAEREHASGSPQLTTALAREPQTLEPPEWGVTGFSFPHIVQPVLDRHCTKCHNAAQQPKGIDLSGDRTDFFNVAYEHLARQGTWGERNIHLRGVGIASRSEGRSPYTSWIATINGTEYNVLMIEPKQWGSPASKLTEILLSGHPDADGKPRIALPPADRRRVFAWIDLNVPYYHTASSSYLENIGCRQVYPANLDKTLADVAKRRCASCHAGGRVPRKFYTRIENPQHNSFLLAPLAKAAGGTEACGKPVFADTADPDYRAILSTFAAVRKLLEQTPRTDMAAIE